MAITDLTGTTWNIPGGWSATAGYGYFTLECELDDGITSRLCDYVGIGYGWLWDSDIVPATPIDDYITANYGGVNKSEYSRSTTLLISITGGESATDTMLIRWLQEHGNLLSSTTRKIHALIRRRYCCFKRNAQTSQVG